MDNERFVYRLSCGHLHILIEECIADPTFEILKPNQRELFREFMMVKCANRHYNENRIRHYVRQALVYAGYDSPVCRLEDVVVKKLINTQLSIGRFTSKEYQEMLIEDENIVKRVHSNEPTPPRPPINNVDDNCFNSTSSWIRSKLLGKCCN